MRKLIAVIALLACTAAEAGQYTVENYRLTKASSDPRAAVIVGAVASGIIWTNSLLKARGEKPLFCVPEKLPVNSYTFVNILDREIEKFTASYVERGEDIKDEHIGLLLLYGLLWTFPCEGVGK